MPDKIETPREFLDHIALLDVAQFESNSADLRLAFHACISLFSLRDWVFLTYNSTPWVSSGLRQTQFNSKSDLQRSLNSIEREFTVVTDIANATKHMKLEPRKSQTNLWGSANVAIQSTTGNVAGTPVGMPSAPGGNLRITVRIDTTDHDVSASISAVKKMWKALFAENSW